MTYWNMKIFNKVIFLSLMMIIQSCAIVGIHFQVHNPKRPGKMPKFAQDVVLLGEMTRYRDCFDVYYYDLSVNIDPSEKSLDGSVEIYATALTDIDTLQLDLHENFDITRLTEHEKGNEMTYKREERAVFIPVNLTRGERFCLKIDYIGKPLIAKKPPWKGGFVWKKDKEGKPWIGVACESEGASVWWPLKDHTSDEPDSMRMHFTVPRNLMAVSNGQLEGTVEQGSCTTFNWFVSSPINTYNVTVYAGDFRLISDEYTGINGQKLALDYYVLDRNYEKAKTHFKQVLPILKVYEEKFGEYPWYRDGFKLVESPYAGMEHQTAIAYGNKYKNDADPSTDYIILHEAAHEWWGNSVTARDFSDVWLQEGFATYAEALYFEEMSGEKGFNNHIFFIKIFIKNKYPLVGVKDRRWFHYRKSSDVYFKGAWILQTLRMQLNNDNLFFDIIRTFAEKYKYQLVESKDFIDLVNQKTNSDYNWFFDLYLYENCSPELEYNLVNPGRLYYRWNRVSPEFNKLTVRLQCNDKIFTLTPTDQVQRIDLQPDHYGNYNFMFYRDILFAVKRNNHLIQEKK